MSNATTNIASPTATPAAGGPPPAALASSSRKYGVLYVDDEEQALKYFKRFLERDFPVFTAPNVPAALAVLEKEHANIGVVLSDQRMPGQTGVELLKAVRERWPNVVRILITAYSEVETAIDAVNSGSIYKYLTKPADLPQLKIVLQGALERFTATNDKETVLHERLASLRRLVVADRVQSLAAMADGISHHLRNSMTAMNCFLEEAKSDAPPPPPAAIEPSSQPPAGAGGDAYLGQLWTLAHNERAQLLTLLQSVGQAAIRPKCQWTSGIDLKQLIATAAGSAPDLRLGPAVDRNVDVQIAAGVVPVKGDAEKLTYLFRTLRKYAATLSGGAAPVRVKAEPLASLWNAPGVRLTVSCDGPAWAERDVAALFTPFAFPMNDPSDLGVEMLVAFFIAHQHGGDITVHREAPAGPGFEVLLAVDPAAIRRPELEDHLLEKSLNVPLNPPRPNTTAA